MQLHAHTHTAVKHAMKHVHIHTPRWSRILVVSQVSSSIRKPIMFCTWAYRLQEFRAIVQICVFLVLQMFHLSKKIMNAAEKPHLSLVYILE